ncbi:hypothetical protein GCM10027168_05960 [Streptomyces capparidis]
MGRHRTGGGWPVRVRVEFEGGRGTIAAAREAAAAYALALAADTPARAPGARDNLLLVVSELVTNAVRHAPGPCVLHLSHSRAGVRVVVSDTSRTLPRVREADPAGGGGLGWPLVRLLARRAGAVPRPDGKDVHAVVPW